MYGIKQSSKDAGNHQLYVIQFVKKSDKVRASLEQLGTVQCKIRTEDSLNQNKVVNVAESGISVSNFSTDPADAIRQQLDMV